MALNASNGCRQAAQWRIERQRVGPNALSRTVRFEPQYGQAMASSGVAFAPAFRTGSDRRPETAGGGAKPDWVSFSRPAAEIRSVVQGVANETMTSIGTPRRASRSWMALRISSTA